MKVLHLNTYTYKRNLDFPHYQFHKELQSAGEESVILSAKGDFNEEGVLLLNRGGIIPYFGISRFVRKIWFEIIKCNKLNYFYPEWNLDFITEKQIEKALPFKPDIILTYWTKFAFNQKLIYKLSKKYDIPVLCLMMDMAPLTGGCHYAYDCLSYKEECGECPALHSNRKKDLSFRTIKLKREFINKTDISLVTGSTTGANQANESILFKGKNITKLYSGINEQIFCSADKKHIRKKLGIPQEKKVIFFGAAYLKEKRKGFSYLTEALEILSNMGKEYKNDDIFLLIAGKGLINTKLPYEHKHMGYLKTQEELASAYQASDLFLCSSIEDTGPLMINQSIMCGRPVVSFDMGVAPDLVHNGKTGYRAKLKDSEDLAKGLDSILKLNKEEWDCISRQCRELGMQLFSMQKHTEYLLNIINEAINRHNDIH